MKSTKLNLLEVCWTTLLGIIFFMMLSDYSQILPGLKEIIDIHSWQYLVIAGVKLYLFIIGFSTMIYTLLTTAFIKINTFNKDSIKAVIYGAAPNFLFFAGILWGFVNISILTVPILLLAVVYNVSNIGKNAQILDISKNMTTN